MHTNAEAPPAPRRAKKTRADYRLAWFQNLRTRLTDYLRSARIYHPTHDEMLANRKRILFDSPQWKKLGEVYRARLCEIFQYEQDRLFEESLEWETGNADRSYTRTPSDPWTERDSELCRTGELYGGHYWMKSGKPFGEWHNLGTRAEPKSKAGK